MIQQVPEGEQLTVKQMLDRLKDQYPSAEFRIGEGSFPSSQIRFENGWTVSLSYDRLSCCDAKFETDPLNSTTVEVAVFKPDESWYIAEGMSVGHEHKTGVLCWQNSNLVFQIVDYVAELNDPIVQEGRIR